MRAAAMLSCLGILCFSSPTLAEDMNFPSWGAPVASVLAQRALSSFTGESSRSLLFSVPVYVLHAEENVDGRPCSVLYSFWEGALLEYMIFFHGEKEALYREIRASLLKKHLSYEGPYFTEIKDVFISRDGSTLYLLLSGRETMLYALDAETYDKFQKAL